MLRNILVATVRNLARNRLYAAISIGGLGLGMAAALLTAVFIRDELSFDSFMPGHDRVFVAAWRFTSASLPPQEESWSIARLASLLKLDFPEIDQATRLMPVTYGVRRGALEAAEKIGWADANFFRVMPYPAIAGDPATALEHPNTVVITRAGRRR